MSRAAAATATLDALHALESFSHAFLNWKPFSTATSATTTANKRHCRADRATSLFLIDLDMSKLSLFDDGPTKFNTATTAKNSLLARKRRRRRRGSRSVSGRSSDRRSAAANVGTCSDFLMVGTDSSGEMFGEVNWASDVSVSEKESVVNMGFSGGQSGNFLEGNESGYGSDSGYRGDEDIGHDEEEDEDARALFWGDDFGGSDSKLERVGENSLQKAHHRGRRKKHG